MAPGIPLPNFAHATATLHGNLDTDVRLFQFDVTTFSDLTLFLQTASNESFDLKLLNDQGRYLQCDCGSEGEETIRREMRPGRYFVVVQAENFESGQFTLSRQSRTITHVRVSFDGSGYEQISPGASTRVTATVSPAVDGPVTFELEYFDPVQRWQFRGYYHADAVNGVAVLPFTPPAAGRWRATVVYQRHPQRGTGDERLGQPAGRRPAHSVTLRTISPLGAGERRGQGRPCVGPADEEAAPRRLRRSEGSHSPRRSLRRPVSVTIARRGQRALVGPPASGSVSR